MKIYFEFDVTPLEARKLFGLNGHAKSLPENDSGDEIRDRSNVHVEEIATDPERMISRSAR